MFTATETGGGARAIGGGATPPGCVRAAPGTIQLAVEAGRVPVFVHIPKGLPAGRTVPVVVVLPGASQSGGAIAAYTGYSKLADRERFIVAYPTATGQRPFWNVSGSLPGKPDDVAYLRRLIGALTGDRVCGDRTRVAMTGLSNGGGMTARMACEAADLLSAAAPVAGGYSTLPACKPARPLPVLEVHGMRDSVVPYGGRGPERAGAVDTFLSQWRIRDRCRTPSRLTRAGTVVQERWQCGGGRVVARVTIDDAEHGWPGENSLAPGGTTARTYAFLRAFSNPIGR